MVGVILCAFVALMAAAFVAIRRPDSARVLETTRGWARLAPLPSDAQGIQVQPERHEVGRAYRITFHVPVASVAPWVAASPGLLDATVEAVDDFTTKYLITPSEGVQHAEVVITTLGNGNEQVEIYVLEGAAPP